MQAGPRLFQALSHKKETEQEARVEAWAAMGQGGTAHLPLRVRKIPG